MTKEQLDAMCDAANRRLGEWIARSAGQHKRAITAGFSYARMIQRRRHWINDRVEKA